MWVFLQVILSSVALALVSEMVAIVAAQSAVAGLASKLGSVALLGLTAEGQRFTIFTILLLFGVLAYFAARHLIQIKINPSIKGHEHELDNLTGCRDGT